MGGDVYLNMSVTGLGLDSGGPFLIIRAPPHHASKLLAYSLALSNLLVCNILLPSPALFDEAVRVHKSIDKPEWEKSLMTTRPHRSSEGLLTAAENHSL